MKRRTRKTKSPLERKIDVLIELLTRMCEQNERLLRPIREPHRAIVSADEAEKMRRKAAVPGLTDELEMQIDWSRVPH